MMGRVALVLMTQKLIGVEGTCSHLTVQVVPHGRVLFLVQRQRPAQQELRWLSRKLGKRPLFEMRWQGEAVS